MVSLPVNVNFDFKYIYYFLSLIIYYFLLIKLTELSNNVWTPKILFILFGEYINKLSSNSTTTAKSIAHFTIFFDKIKTIYKNKFIFYAYFGCIIW